MKDKSRHSWAFLACCLLATIVAACSHRQADIDSSWNPEAAAGYLDQREGVWSTWPGAARDHGTFCVSCHTALDYALSRPALRPALGERGPTAQEIKLLQNVTKRVRQWSSNDPYYNDMPDQSRDTEAVLDALILASNDAQTGHLSADTHAAFGQLWSTQQIAGATKGAWLWIYFNNEPWEAADSPYYGAALAAVAIGIAPENYRAVPGIQPKIALLRDYLVQNSAAQTPINRANLLWASEKLPGLLAKPQQDAIIAEILTAQRADGGWCLSTLIGSWKRHDGTPLVLKSDGYATGFLTYVLEESGMPRDSAPIQRGLAWLARNQSWWSGNWPAYSLNHRRVDTLSNVSHFMDDAATAYAVLALTDASTPESAATHSASSDPASNSAAQIQPR